MISRIILRRYEKIANKLVKKSVSLHEKHRPLHENDPDALWACLVEILGIDGASAPTATKDHIQSNYLSCIHGLVYFAGLNDPLKGAMKMRCAQFIGFVDRAFSLHGVKPCPETTREQLLVALDLYDVYQSSPELFE